MRYNAIKFSIFFAGWLMLTFRFLFISGLVLTIESCAIFDTSLFNYSASNDAKVSNSKETVVIKPSILHTEKLVDNKVNFIQKQVKNTSSCQNIDLDKVDVANFVFTPEINHCLENSPEFYKYLLFLYKHNAKVANKKLQKFLEYNKQKSLSLNSIVQIANKRLLVWLNRPSETEDLNIVKPVLKLPDTKVTLEKNEFETTQEFEKRVSYAQGKVSQAVEVAKQNFATAMRVYEKEVASYNHSLALEKKERKQQGRSVYTDILGEEVRHILGDPFIDESMIYDADKEIFYATLLATNSDWKENIGIHVPRIIAKDFKENSSTLTPILGFDINEQGELFISTLVIRFDFQNYKAKLEKEFIRPTASVKTIQVQH